LRSVITLTEDCELIAFTILPADYMNFWLFQVGNIAVLDVTIRILTVSEHKVAAS
jgi:hypothetical protein